MFWRDATGGGARTRVPMVWLAQGCRVVAGAHSLLALMIAKRLQSAVARVCAVNASCMEHRGRPPAIPSSMARSLPTVACVTFKEAAGRQGAEMAIARPAKRGVFRRFSPLLIALVCLAAGYFLGRGGAGSGASAVGHRPSAGAAKVRSRLFYFGRSGVVSAQPSHTYRLAC